MQSFLSARRAEEETTGGVEENSLWVYYGEQPLFVSVSSEDLHALPQLLRAPTWLLRLWTTAGSSRIIRIEEGRKHCFRILDPTGSNLVILGQTVVPRDLNSGRMHSNVFWQSWKS